MFWVALMLRCGSCLELKGRYRGVLISTVKIGVRPRIRVGYWDPRTNRNVKFSYLLAQGVAVQTEATVQTGLGCRGSPQD